MTDRQEDLYRDLTFTADMYIAGEQVFPLWETIYAATIAGLLVAYFATAELVAQIALSLIGALFSLHWSRVLSRAVLYSHVRHGRMKDLAEQLRGEISSARQSPIDQIAEFNLFREEKIEVARQATWWSKSGTWSLRLSLPRILLLIWLVLAIASIYQIFSR